MDKVGIESSKKRGRWREAVVRPVSLRIPSALTARLHGLAPESEGYATSGSRFNCIGGK